MSVVWVCLAVSIGVILPIASILIARRKRPRSFTSRVQLGLSGELPLQAAMSREPVDMIGATGFRVRLRVRLAKALTTDAHALSVIVLGREVTIVSQEKSKSLTGEKWLVLRARGFADEKEAWEYGKRLTSMVQLASLSSRLGVDVGEGKPSTWVSEEFARSMGLINAHERIAPNVHGLAVLPDDDLTRFPIMKAEGNVTADPNQLTSAVHELGEHGHYSLGKAANGVRLLNLALMTSDALAQMVLAFSPIEELGQDQTWSEVQKQLIEQIAATAENAMGHEDDERMEVATAIRKGLFRLSLREGVKRVLASGGVDHLIKDWDRLYKIRSGVFHGTAQLSESELHAAAQDTITLCTRILLAIISNEGGRVPSIATTHYGAWSG